MAVGQIGEITPSALTSVDMERKQEKEHVQNQNQQTVVETATDHQRRALTAMNTSVQVGTLLQKTLGIVGRSSNKNVLKKSNQISPWASADCKVMCCLT